MHNDARGNDVYDIEDATLGSYMADGTRSGFDGGMVRSRGALKAEESKLSADTSSKKLRQSKAKANDRYSATKK